jgi:hypothetical protein
LKLIFRYVPPSPNRLDEDISEIMLKEGNSFRNNKDNTVWETSDMFLVETPVS